VRLSLALQLPTLARSSLPVLLLLPLSSSHKRYLFIFEWVRFMIDGQSKIRGVFGDASKREKRIIKEIADW